MTRSQVRTEEEEVLEKEEGRVQEKGIAGANRCLAVAPFAAGCAEAVKPSGA